MIKHIFIVLSFLAITACSGGDSDNGESTGPGNPVVKEGQFLDSAVVGLFYVSGSQTGFTDNNGTYQYEEGATVQFLIGDIVIGEAAAKPMMTPLDLVEEASDELDSTVTNIARFLQTLDNDANLDNGITITESVRTLAIGKSLDFDQDVEDFENDENVQNIVAELTAVTTTGIRPLISSQQAQSHLNYTLLVRRITFPSPQDITARGDIGLWMFKPEELSMDAIAHWLNQPYEDKRLLEPVNVLWVDFVSLTEEEARARVSTFLKNRDFFTEYSWLHSRGYFGYYKNGLGVEVWKPQYGATGDPEDVAWVDFEWPGANNHGRIFPAVKIWSNTGDPVYVTSGAFSSESECKIWDGDFLCTDGHNYVSFNFARDKLNNLTNVSTEWTAEPLKNVGNQYKPELALNYTTGDHNGVRVFGLYPLSVTITSPVDGAQSSSTDFISFEGNAVKADGVVLSDYALVWESDRDGEIGLGPSLTLDDLSVGTHIITLTAIDEQGARGSESVTISVSDGSPEPCQDVSGNWYIDDSATITCSGSFGSGTQTENGSGNINITQNGCNINFVSPADTIRTGSVSGYNINFDGVVAQASQDVVIDQNYINFSGVISQDLQTIYVTGTGAVTGSVSGVSGSCTVSSTETFMR